MIASYHLNYFNLIQSTPTRNLCNFRLTVPLFFSKGCFHEAEPLFTHMFLYCVYLVSFWGTQGLNTSILYHQNNFELLQSIPISNLSNYRLPNCLIFRVKAVFMKSTPLLQIFSYILHILTASEAPRVKK